jgi:hypothetical protein
VTSKKVNNFRQSQHGAFGSPPIGEQTVCQQLCRGIPRHPRPSAVVSENNEPKRSSLTAESAARQSRSRNRGIREIRGSGGPIEWRLDKAQQNGAFLRKWPQMLAGGSRKPGSIPCEPRFPRAGWVSTEAKKDPGGLRPPEATLKPPSGHLVANR